MSPAGVYAALPRDCAHVCPSHPGGGGLRPTARQRAILLRAARGESYQQIADALCLSAKTIESHLHHLCQRLGVHGSLGALALMVARGEVTADELAAAIGGRGAEDEATP